MDYYNWWFICVLVFVVAGILGNVLVCLAVSLERPLQNVTNWFLVSLAFADLIVSTIVMPFGAAAGFLGTAPPPIPQPPILTLSLRVQLAEFNKSTSLTMALILNVAFLPAGMYESGNQTPRSSVSNVHKPNLGQKSFRKRNSTFKKKKVVREVLDIPINPDVKKR